MRTWYGLALLSVLCLVACDSSGDGGGQSGGGGNSGSAASGEMTCDSLNFMANTNSPVGVWTLHDVCVTVVKNPLENACQNSQWSPYLVEADATREFREDGTTSNAGSGVTGETWELASECLDASNDTCAGLQVDLLGDDDIAAVQCSENTGLCTCEITRKPTEFQTGALWKVEGDKLQIQKDGTWDDGVHFMSDDNNLVLKGTTDYLVVYTVYHRD